MRDDYTHLALLVDRSGSMESIREDAEGGVKSLIAEQRALPGELTVDLYHFDDQFEKVEDIDGWTLQPRGMTALLDSMGKAIVDVGERLAAMPEDERPAKVVFVITTDGLENASQEWTREKVFEHVQRQTDDYAWQFIFQAANQDAIAEGHSLGVRNNMNYSHTRAGTKGVYAAASASIGAYRSGVTQDVQVPENAPEKE